MLMCFKIWKKGITRLPTVFARNIPDNQDNMHVVSRLKTRAAVNHEKNYWKFDGEYTKTTVDLNAFLEPKIKKFASINFINIQVCCATLRMGIFHAFKKFSKLA